ncbi:MAG: hypothetical protein V1660_00785 [archaeon]
MNKARLQTLGINVELLPSMEFKDDGFVDDIEEHTKKLDAYYEVPPRKLPEELRRMEILGRCMTFVKNHSVHSHIYYINTDMPPLNIEVRAHEETHALDNMGRLDLLEKKILTEFNTLVHLHRIPDPEVRAEMGAIYALKRYDFDPKIINQYHKKDKDFDAAMSIFSNGKIPGKIPDYMMKIMSL